MLPVLAAVLIPAKIITSAAGTLGAAWVGNRAKKWITDKLISKEIKNARETLRKKIQDWSEEWGKSVIITIILNYAMIGLALSSHFSFTAITIACVALSTAGAFLIARVLRYARKDIKRSAIAFFIAVNTVFVLLSFVSHFLFTVNAVTVFLVSLISIYMILRFLIGNIKSIIVFAGNPYKREIIYYSRSFLGRFFRFHGLSSSIRRVINEFVHDMYHEKANKATKAAHWILSKLRFVKSINEISEEIQDEFYDLITGYTVRLVVYKATAFLVYCAVFAFLLRPFVFSYTMDMNFLNVVLYPFTVAPCTIIEIIKGWA